MREEKWIGHHNHHGVDNHCIVVCASQVTSPVNVALGNLRDASSSDDH
ncbi:hypothetical protein [Arsenophonus endosymbiont of Aleurodicus floccissimus]|nr:hypothetical protein [Arsenophonus endosymbiont of Aleurodicus floccissimus]